MGLCGSRCSSDAPWKPFVTTSVRNVVTHTLMVEPSLYMVKECACKSCRTVNQRKPTAEEAMKYNGLLDDMRKSLSGEEPSKRKSMAIR